MSLTIADLRLHVLPWGNRIVRRVNRTTIRGLSWAVATDGKYALFVPSVHTRIPEFYSREFSRSINGVLRQRGTEIQIRDLLRSCREARGGERWRRNGLLPLCTTAIVLGESLLNPHLVLKALRHAANESAKMHHAGPLDPVVFVGTDSTWIAAIMPALSAHRSIRYPLPPDARDGCAGAAGDANSRE